MGRHSVSNSRSNTPPRQRRSPQKRSGSRSGSPAPRRSEPQDNATEPKVYVSGLPPNTKKEDLEEMFGKCGSVSDLFVVNKDSFAFAFVLYEDHRAAQEAISELNGAKVKGKSIKCEIAKPRPPRGNNESRGRGRDGGNRGKGCFKCGQDGHFARECPNEQDTSNNRGPRREDNRDRHKRSDDERTGSPARRNRNRSTSSSPRRNQRKRSRSSSASVRQKKRESPRRRNPSPSSSRSNHKRRGGKHSRSRSAELRKGKKRVSRSNSSR